MIPANFRKFVSDAILHLVEYGTSVSLPYDEKVEGCSGYYASGWESASGGELCVATAKPWRDWGEIFLHEYSHFLQQLDDDAGIELAYPVLSECQSARMWAAVDPVWSGTEGVEPYAGAELRWALEAAQRMEADCDRRALELIRDHSLPFDIDMYTRKANAYHMFYSVLCTTRRWWDAPAYYVPEIVEKMPTTLLNTWEPTPELVDMYIHHCYDDVTGDEGEGELSELGAGAAAAR